jgi:hypothetical protein
MSHHASGPDFGFPHRDARLDMTDLYAFLKPGDPCQVNTGLQCTPVLLRESSGAHDY